MAKRKGFDRTWFRIVEMAVQNKESVITASILLYAGLYLVVGIGGISFQFQPAQGYVQTSSNSGCPAGSMWIEGNNLHWCDGSIENYAVDESNDRISLVDSSSSGPAGSVWIEGSDLHWIDTNSNEYSYTGVDTTNTPSASAGNAWVEHGNVHYIDENGNERFVDPPLGEAGRQTGLNGNEWQSGSFSVNYGETPLVFATTNTDNGGQDPSAAHVRSITTSGFETQHCEFDGGDSCDSHADETNGWLAIDPDTVGSSPHMEAGVVTTSSTTEDRTSVSFSNSFANAPIVFAQSQTENDVGKPHNVIVENVDTSGFTLQFCDQGSTDGCESHGSEDVVWWAIDPSNADRSGTLDWGTVSVSDSNWNSVSFNNGYGTNPAVIATVQTNNGGSEALYPEVTNVGQTGADVRYCESDGGDSCDSHATETVAWLSAETGSIYQ